jgi:HEAT repeat protein
MPRLIIKEKGLETRSVTVPQGMFSIGRSSKNKIVVNNRFASSRHCQIVYDGEECTVVDLDSTNGLFVNGNKVTLKKLEDGDRIFVGSALLIYIANEQAIKVDTLQDRLKSDSAQERELAADLLGLFGGQTAAAPLVAALKEDPEVKVKAAAAEALGMLGVPDSAKVLLGYFDTADPTLRNSVVRAIVRLADDKMIEGIARYLKHEDSRVRVLAAHTLGRTGNRLATKFLVKSLTDETFAVREAVIKALGDVGDPSVAETLVAAVDDIRYPKLWVVDTLGKLGNLSAAPTLMRTLEDPSPEVREAAAEALGKLRAEQALPALINALEDSDPKVRATTANALEKLRKHIEMVRKLSPLAGKEKQTVEMSSIGDSDARLTEGGPLYGENPARWRAWWSQLPPA